MTLEPLSLEGQRTTNVAIEDIRYGLDVVLSSFEKPYFPRRISTFATHDKQVLINSIDEAIEMFIQSNLLDCKISAYKYPVPELDGINRQIPNFFLSDLDRKDFDTDELLEQRLQQTLHNFDKILYGAKPTVIWSGGGYHLLQSLDADIVLEEESIFKEFLTFEPSRKLMSYAEMKMTNNKCDSVHNHTVAFNNCMIRVPNSYNSKYVRKSGDVDLVRSKVRIIQLGNHSTYLPNIRYLLEDLWEYLIHLRNKETVNRLETDRRRIKFQINHPYDVTPPGVKIERWNSKTDWVERLIEKPLDDGRKYCIVFVLLPYFINIRRLSDIDAYNKTIAWLEKSRSVKRLDFNAKWKVKNDIKSIRKLQQKGRFVKPSLSKMKERYPQLYARLQKEGVVAMTMGY